MAFARAHGMRCVLTLGGCTPEEELHQSVDKPDRRPDFYVDSVADFLKGSAQCDSLDCAL